MKLLSIKKNTVQSRRNPELVHFRRKRSFLGRIFNFRKILVYLLLILLIFAGYFYIKNLNLSENLVLKQTEYEGLDRLTKAQLDISLTDKFGQNMIGLNLRQMERKLITDFIEVSNVRAEKIYPDKVVFKIEEKTAKLVLSNFNGKFLVDENGEILKSVCRDDLQKFDAFDYLLARGFGDANADYVEDIVIANLPEDVKIEEFDYSQFPYEEKVKILKELELQKETEMNDEINFVWENINLELTNIDVPSMKSWSEDCFKVGVYTDSTLISFLADTSNILKNQLKYEIKDLNWDGEFRLVVILNNGTRLIFSPSRTLDIQIEDLESILLYSQKAVYDFRLIDLSSQKVLVE